MGDVLKGIAALVLVAAAFKWAVTTVVDKAIANSDGTANGFQFECQPLEFPETNFSWNTNWMVDSGIVVGRDGGAGTPPAAAKDGGNSARDRSSDSATAKCREQSAQAREMHDAIRTSSDPRREMERFRARMRDRN